MNDRPVNPLALEWRSHFRFLGRGPGRDFRQEHNDVAPTGGDFAEPVFPPLVKGGVGKRWKKCRERVVVENTGGVGVHYS